MEQDVPLVKHGLGVAAGGTSGLGVSYRGATKKFGWQSTLGAFGTSQYFNMYGGLEFLYYFYETHYGHRWYTLVGSGFTLESFKQVTLTPGAGAGIEFLLMEKLAISVGISFAPIVPIAQPKYSIVGYAPLPFPRLAILYNF